MNELTTADFELAGCQAVAFTPEGDLSTSTIVRELLPRWTAEFDADPTLLPAIQGAPPDVPRVLLQNKSGTLRCELAAARASFYWNRSSSAIPAVPQAFEPLAKLVADYVAATRRRVGRLAALVTRVAVHDNPGLFLARHFCQERWLEAPFNRPENFELHAHKRFALGPFTVNSWVRNKTGLLGPVTGVKKPIVIAEQDLNTLDEESPSRQFSLGEAQDFFSRAVVEFDTILALYYPPGSKA